MDMKSRQVRSVKFLSLSDHLRKLLVHEHVLFNIVSLSACKIPFTDDLLKLLKETSHAPYFDSTACTSINSTQNDDGRGSSLSGMVFT